MTITLNKTEYFRTKEAAEDLGVSKQTLLRWISEGKILDAKKRDRNDWRLFSVEELEKIKSWMIEGD